MERMDYALRLQAGEWATPQAMTATAQRAEALGFATIWTSEAGHDPYLPVMGIAAATRAVRTGTAIAVAYARSPWSTASASWDLQRYSGGRFVLGLATQVKAHIERRYSSPWPGGVGALEEYVACCRAIWRSFQTGEKPSFEGANYRYNLINPEFNPGPLPEAQADIPVWLAAVNALSAKLAGRVAHGLHVHAFHTQGYLRDVLMPAVRAGRGETTVAGLAQRPMDATCSVFAGIAHDERQVKVIRDTMRDFIAFYASTPAYKPVLDHEGCGDIHAPLRAMTREGRWKEMAALVDDAILDKFLVVDTPRRLGRRINEKYKGLLTEVSLYREGGQFASEADWAELLAGLKE